MREGGGGRKGAAFCYAPIRRGSMHSPYYRHCWTSKLVGLEDVAQPDRDGLSVCDSVGPFLVCSSQLGIYTAGMDWADDAG